MYATTSDRSYNARIRTHIHACTCTGAYTDPQTNRNTDTQTDKHAGSQVGRKTLTNGSITGKHLPTHQT